MPKTLKKLQTHLDYLSTEERKDYCRAIDIAELKRKLPTGYYTLVQDALLEHGFDYPYEYIKECLRNDHKRKLNHYVLQIAQSLTVELDNIHDYQYHYKGNSGKKIKPATSRKVEIDLSHLGLKSNAELLSR